MMMNSMPMSDLSVLLTRPAHQSQQLASMITDAGAKVVLFPTLAIRNIASVTTEDLSAFDIVIFLSANAVVVDQPNARVIAMGPGTQEAMVARNYTQVLLPEPPYNSESILAMPELQSIQSKKIAIIAGKGGRNLLQQSLLKLGAHVEKIDVYQRFRPDSDLARLNEFWLATTRVIVSTSIESLQNLIEMVPETQHPLLFATPLLVISDRVATAAKSMAPFESIIVAGSAQNQAIFQTLKKCYNSHLL